MQNQIVSPLGNKIHLSVPRVWVPTTDTDIDELLNGSIKKALRLKSGASM
jgi:hypothetical protein